MTDIFSVETVLFTLWGYPMSYLEFFGTLLNLGSVWLVSRKSVWNWPVGILGVILYIFLFYQIQLYADFFEQIYFLVTGFYGWWAWTSLRPRAESPLEVRSLGKEGRVVMWLTVAMGTVILGWCTSQLNVWFPAFFVEPASYPYLDAGTTAMSFIATLLMVWRYVESWWLWVVVDVIGIGLYFAKDVRFIALEYGIFLVMAVNGWRLWLASQKEHLQ